MTFPLEHTDVPAASTPSRVRHAYRAGTLLVLLAVAVPIVLIPLAVSSILDVLQRPVAGRAHVLMSPAALHGEWTKLNVATIGMNETAQTVTLRVSGFHNCPGRCPVAERVQLFSVHAAPTGSLGTPPSASVDLPANSGEIDQQVTLPMQGNLLDYPFDHYRLLLGVAFSHVTAKGTTIPFSPRAAHAGLAYSIGDDIPRVSMSTSALLAARSYDTPGVTYASVAALTLSRPAYLQVLAVDLTLLVVISAIYGVVFRPFEQIIPTVGGVILGVWGVRSLLVGGYPPDSTGIDLVLESAIFVVLLLVGARSVRFMWPNTHFARAKAADPPGR